MLKLDAYKLKWIAIIGMVLNHIVIAWWDIVPLPIAYPFFLLGGLTFPIMAFFVVEGYKHTRSLKRYVGRILIIGLIALPFHVLTLGVAFLGDESILAAVFSLNIMFTIALSLWVLYLYDKIKSRVAFWLLFIFIIMPISLLFFEWAPHGVLMVLLFYTIKKEKARRVLPPIIAIVVSLLAALILLIPGFEPPEMTGITADANYELVSITFPIGMLLASFLLLGYNNERGKSMKWLFYIFYPAHLAILALGRFLLEL